MILSIISFESNIKIEIVWIEANTLEGNFVIQTNHIDTTLLLSANKTICYRLKNGKQESLMVKNGGLLNVCQNEITLLLD